ncbi:MAG: PAS domain-containing protein [Verrucomicrobiota bacterium]|jgi:PAS domain S-box-containing protein
MRSCLVSRLPRRDGIVDGGQAAIRCYAVLLLLALILGLAMISLRPEAPTAAAGETMLKLPWPAPRHPDLSLLTARHMLWGIAASSAAGLLGLVWVGVLMRSQERLERRAAGDVEALARTEAELRDLRALYRSLMDNLPGSVFRKDVQGRYTFANSQFCRLRGWGEDEVLKKTVYDYLPPQMAAEVAREDEIIQQTGKFFEIEKEDSTPNGAIRYIHILKGPVYDAAGKLLGTQGMITDITEWKSAQADLEFERGLMRFLLDNSPDHIFFKDLQSRFIKCSQHQAEMFGRKHPDEVLGKTDFDFFDEEFANRAFQDEQEIIRTGVPMVGKVIPEKLKDGRVSWALTTKMPLRDRTGKLIGTFGISKDITALKESEAKLKQIHLELLETSRVAGMAEVATSVLHNVGNVLNSVNVSAALVTESMKKIKAGSLAKIAVLLKEHEQDLGTFISNDPKGRLLPSYLSKLSGHLLASQVTAIAEMELLRENIEHINGIVAMQQNYARVSGVKETVEVHHLVEDSLRIYAGSMDRQEVEIVRDFQKVPPISVEKHKILQILINLLCNAAQACDESGRADKRVMVRVANGAGRLKISVVDNGVGIPAENLTRIFSHGFTTRPVGHGFGLHANAIAAKEIGATLIAHSDGPGTGASFTLELSLPSEEETLHDSGVEIGGKQ